ncbi:shikimate kinase [Hydrogenispora ethanolica]|uniref:Shikimate kinase n=1 Tax=Hydrogenispora ethanolica TaxID=1082276 RepID=A0A4R1RVT7_HYDET|nr:shikimate kinase [Hydrogenispora ethanolica]TCL70783.1 shikimate kinase [Hydrogenispora ethanolica]
MKIALIGFMGTGKTLLGRMLAARLHYEFIDTDQLIEIRQGQSIAELFATRGEAYFRQLEQELARELAGRDGLVIATGGGFVLNPVNLERLREGGVIVSLIAPAETIYDRVKCNDDRPLLAVADPLARIRELLQQRAVIYQGADIVLDTSLKVPDELIEELVSRLTAKGYGNEII